MAVGVLAVEAAAARRPRDYLNETAASYRFAARSVEGASRSADVLIFGDSQLKFGLLPSVVAAEPIESGQLCKRPSGASEPMAPLVALPIPNRNRREMVERPNGVS